jgi:MATE family, multidrug efflux pump
MVTTAAPSAASVETHGSPYRVILRLAAPTVLAMLTQSIVNEIDIVFFSRLPCPESSNAQAALLPSLILLWMFGGSLSAISVGTQAIAARRFAERKSADAGGVLLNSWCFSLAASCMFTALGYASLPLVLRFLIQVPEVREAARAYMGWRLLGIASMAISFSFKAFFDGIGKTYVHMVSAITMNALNIVLCFLFIFGNLGAPRMGIAGAGLAGCVSSWVGLLVMVGWANLPDYRRTYGPFSVKKLDRSIIGSILRLSVPSAVATVAVMTGFALFSMIVSRLDMRAGAQMMAASCPGGRAEAVNSAATMVIVGILKLTFTACLAFGTSTATLVSQSLGHRDPERAARFGWASVRLGLVIFGVVGLSRHRGRNVPVASPVRRRQHHVRHGGGAHPSLHVSGPARLAARHHLRLRSRRHLERRHHVHRPARHRDDDEVREGRLEDNPDLSRPDSRAATLRRCGTGSSFRPDSF